MKNAMTVNSLYELLGELIKNGKGEFNIIYLEDHGIGSYRGLEEKVFFPDTDERGTYQVIDKCYEDIDDTLINAVGAFEFI